MPGARRPTNRKGPTTLPEVFELIDRTAKKLRAIQRQTMREANLTPAQYFMLALLWAGDAQPLKDLATAGGYSRATVTGIVDTLERKGLVVRAPNPADRRSLLVVLTAAGRALEQSTPSLNRIFGQCCAGLDPGEVQRLGRLLQELHDSLPT